MNQRDRKYTVQEAKDIFLALEETNIVATEIDSLIAERTKEWNKEQKKILSGMLLEAVIRDIRR